MIQPHNKARVVLSVLACTLFVCVLPGLANAQKRKPRVIQLEEIRIEGRVQKPNAFYILNRSNIGYEVLDLKTSFVRDVVRSVNKEPF